jgi:hypothetical protein
MIIGISCVGTVNVHAQAQEQGAPLICIPEQANITLVFAAEELSKYFKTMTGTDYPITGDGEKDEALLVRLKVDTHLNHDGYHIYRDGPSTCISGGSPRGCLYGVYTLLEELGCRWPVPGEDYEVIPKLKTISWSESEIISEPAIAGRGMVLFGAHNKLDEILELVDWLAKNRFNFLFLCGDKLPSEALPKIKEAFTARDMELEWGMHWLPKYLPRELFKEHPEYFRMEGGKRTEKLNMCPSSSEAANIIAKNSLKEWGNLRDFPHLETLHLWPDDLGKGGWCSCEKCKDLTDSDQTLKVTNEVARRLPLGDTKLAHLSYHTTIYPPKNIKPGKNVRLLYAPRERCYKHALDECAVNRKYLECLEGQIQMFPNKPEIFEYYHDYILFRNLPVPLHPVIGNDTKAYRQAGSARIASLSFRKFSEWAYGPNYYVLGKCLWRGEGDPQDIQEYCNAVYGPCAKVMKRYFDLLFELCGTVMQLCEYEMGADMRNPPHHQPYAKAHAASLAPLVTSEHLDKIESILKIAIAGAAEPYRTRVENQLLLWQFARLEVPAIYQTIIAGHLKTNLSKDATDTDRQYIIDLIKKVFRGLDEGTEILLSAPVDLRGPLTRDKGFMKHRSQGFQRPLLLRWMKELEKQQQDSKTSITAKDLRVRLFPYPHQLKWQGQVAIDVKKLVLLTPASPSKILATAVEDVSKEIEKLCGQKPKVTSKCPDKAGYIIEFKEDGVSCSQLASEANKPQGYQIISKPNEQPPKLVLQGYDSAGVLYASQTLRQLLRAADRKRLLIPKVKVVDWPDLEDRGYFLDARKESKIWDLDGWKQHIDLVASQRFNKILLEITSPRHGKLTYNSRAFPEFVDKEYALSAPGVLPAIIEYGRCRAVHIAPTIPHLDFFVKTLFRDHPGTMMSVKGRKHWDGRIITEDRQAIDFRKQEATEILDRLVRDMIDVLQPDELSVWPTEATWYTAEESLVQSDALYKAFQAATQGGSTCTLRMLTTGITLKQPEEMFRRLPPTVKIDYYDAFGTYSIGRGILFRPQATKTMRDGGFHFSTMPAFGRMFWKSAPLFFPEVIRNNAIISAEEGAQGLVANGGDQPMAYALNYAAGAEFAWNLHGRTIPEFTQAWARQQGWPQPVLIAGRFLFPPEQGKPRSIIWNDP